MIKRCQDAVTLSVDSMVNKNLEQAEKIMESDDDIDLLREYIRDRQCQTDLARSLRQQTEIGTLTSSTTTSSLPLTVVLLRM